MMNLYEKVYKMNAVFGIWHYSHVIRITYVFAGMADGLGSQKITTDPI